MLRPFAGEIAGVATGVTVAGDRYNDTQTAALHGEAIRQAERQFGANYAQAESLYAQSAAHAAKLQAASLAQADAHQRMGMLQAAQHHEREYEQALYQHAHEIAPIAPHLEAVVVSCGGTGWRRRLRRRGHGAWRWRCQPAARRPAAWHGVRCPPPCWSWLPLGIYGAGFVRGKSSW